MNDRIKEIILEHGLEKLGCTSRMEMLGELIVRECAEIALRENHDPYECIMKYFGLETADSTLRNRSTYYGNNP